jgi:hypothetical protein
LTLVVQSQEADYHISDQLHFTLQVA